jgi:hypothetical protein
MKIMRPRYKSDSASSGRGWRRALPSVVALIAILFVPSLSKSAVKESQDQFQRRVLAARGQLQSRGEAQAPADEASGREQEYKLAQYWSNWPNWAKMGGGGGWPNWPNWAKWFNQ